MSITRQHQAIASLIIAVNSIYPLDTIKMIHLDTITHYAQRAVVGFAWVVLGSIYPVLPSVSIFMLLVLLDCYTANRLANRVRRDNPNANDGKVSSKHLGKVVHTIFFGFALIWIAYLMQTHIAYEISLPMRLNNFVALFLCGWQFYSVLENESSCRGSAWAIFLQRFLVDKTSRHLGYDVAKGIEDAKSEASDNTPTK